MPEGGPCALQTAWLGTAGIWVTDGQTSLLIDGFFTRPSLAKVALTRLSPDPQRIASALQRAGITRLDAVLAGHSHYDHALDAAIIANLTGAVLAGSQSFTSLALAAAVPQDRVRPVAPGDLTRFNTLQVEWLASRHNRPDLAAGEIHPRIRLPAHASAFRSGTTFALRILSPAGSLGIMGSAGTLPGMFTNRPADALFLSVAGLSRTSTAAFDQFFDATVRISHPRIVYPIHWDNFFTPLTSEPTYLPVPLDDVRLTLRRLRSACEAHAVKLSLPPFFQLFDPFSGGISTRG